MQNPEAGGVLGPAELGAHFPSLFLDPGELLCLSRCRQIGRPVKPLFLVRGRWPHRAEGREPNRSSTLTT